MGGMKKLNRVQGLNPVNSEVEVLGRSIHPINMKQDRTISKEYIQSFASSLVDM